MRLSVFFENRGLDHKRVKRCPYLLLIGYFFIQIIFISILTIIFSDQVAEFKSYVVVLTVGMVLLLVSTLYLAYVIYSNQKRMMKYKEAYLNSERTLEKLTYDNQKSEFYNLLTNYITNDTHTDEEVIIKVFTYLMKRLGVCDKGSVMRLDENLVTFIYAQGYQLDILNSLELKARDIELFTSGVQLRKNVEKSLEKKMGTEKYNTYSEHAQPIYESIYIGLVEKEKVKLGISLDISQPEFKKKHGTFTDEMMEEVRATQILVNAMLKMKDLVSLRNEMQYGVSSAFIKAFEYHDAYTMGHSYEVARISKLIGECLDYNEDNLNELYWAAMLHDLGKIVIPKQVLEKAGPLSEEEYDLVRTHCKTGASFLENAPGLECVAKYVRHHHESYDGSGYPDGLAGEEIPLSSRIIHLADNYHAMLSERPYRKELTTTAVLQEIINGEGKAYCPIVTEAFLQMFDRIKTESYKNTTERYKTER